MNTQTNHITMQKLLSTITRLEKEIKYVKHSRFSDSIETRFDNENIRTNKIQKELQQAEEWFLSEVQYRENKENQLEKIRYRRAIRRPKPIKKKSIKTINIIFAFILIVLVLLFCKEIDFNKMV